MPPMPTGPSAAAVARTWISARGPTKETQKFAEKLIAGELHVAITRLTASGFAPPSKVAGVRGAGPAPAIVDVAIAGSCVYLASGGRGAVGRAPF